MLSNISVLGQRNYSEVLELQSHADIMISFEPEGDDQLLKTFLPSKVLDYIAGHKPVIAITPENSESWKLCNRGYGWAIKPDDYKGLALLLSGFVEKVGCGDRTLLSFTSSTLEEYSVTYCVEKLSKLMDSLVKS